MIWCSRLVCSPAGRSVGRSVGKRDQRDPGARRPSGHLKAGQLSRPCLSSPLAGVETMIFEMVEL